MGPELKIQTEACTILKQNGWITLRVGTDGLPDIIALHPSGKDVGWKMGKHDSSYSYYIKWTGVLRVNHPKCPYGINFNKKLPGTKLFLEFKRPGGDESPRQKILINILRVFGISEIVDSERRVLKIITDLRLFVKYSDN